MRTEHLAAINQARGSRRAVILVTDLDSGDGQVVAEGQIIGGGVQADIDKAFRSGRSSTVEAGGRKLFLNVQVPPPRIVVIGAVHISQALAAMAPVAGFDLSIIDPRTAFATPERFEGVDLTADWPEDVLKERPLDAYTALVAVTHDPKIDDFPIAEALRTGCFYVGALGSRKTHAKRVERLKEAGITDAQIAGIDAPIGLDIGAQSPAEIAVAVLGAIIQAFRKRDLRV
ncbi:MAG: putative sulfurylase large subunit, molybdopterin cytosine dinucleotide biosynthesis [Rhizobium sp.]|nr:putative sulfurylase large subunit, molybdopterin cytosine dinucleotide biosynthesis [Rhizobium sp.]